MNIIIVNKKFEVIEQDMRKVDFTNIFSLNIRDLRPVFSRLQVATILPREDSVIINLGFIKAILSNDTLYLTRKSYTDIFKVFMDSIMSDDVSDSRLDFAMFMLEQIFTAKTTQLDHNVQKLRSEVANVLQPLRTSLHEEHLKPLLSVKKKLSKLETHLREVYLSGKEVLEDDENFTGLLDITKGKNNGAIELESILEDFIEKIEESIGHIVRAKEEIEDTEEFVDLRLSTRRTHMVKIDLIATLFMAPLSFVAVIVGYYGMNISNGLEEVNAMFLIIGMMLIIFLIVSLVYIFTYLRDKGIL